MSTHHSIAITTVMRDNGDGSAAQKLFTTTRENQDALGDAATSWRSALAFSAIVFMAICVWIYTHIPHVTLPAHISDRRKTVALEILLRITNEYLLDLLEPLIGAVGRNQATRYLTNALFALQPSPPEWCRVTNTPIGGVPCRVYLPRGDYRKSNACLVFIHGGGWCNNRPKIFDGTVVPIIKRVGALLISVDYSLSPEVHFKTALDECERVVNAIYEGNHPEYDIDHNQIAIMGDSAGANMATVLAQRALRQGRISLFKCQVLIYPVIHMLDSLSPSYRDYHRHYKGAGLLNPRMMARWFLLHLGMDATPENVEAVTKNQHISAEIRSNSKIMSLLDYSKIPDEVREEKVKIVDDEKAQNRFPYPPKEELAAKLSKFLTDVEFCPLLGENLQRLAPALILTAGIDILRDEAILYALRLRDDFGVPTAWRHYASAYHAIVQMPCSRLREKMFDDIAEYLRANLQ